MLKINFLCHTLFIINITVPDDIGGKTEGPKQPRGIVFPINENIGKRKTKRFNVAWYGKHKWVTYSVSQQKVYCFPCIHFGEHIRERMDKTGAAFARRGFDDWAHAVGDAKKGLDGHANSKFHTFAVEKWENFKNDPVQIQERMNPERQSLVQENRGYFKEIISYVWWFASQEVAFRGHFEDEESKNRGNFRELMEL